MNETFKKAIELAKKGYGRKSIAKELNISDHVARAASFYVKSLTDADLIDDDLKVDSIFGDFQDGFDESLPAMKIQGTNILFLSDTHFPRHSKEALLKALRYGINNQVDTIYLNGDIMDCDRISRYKTGRTVPSIFEEIETTKKFLTKLRELFPNANIYYKEGNHEKRYVDYIENNAPELAEIMLTLVERLDLDNLGIIHVAENQIATVNSLHVVHGHEYKSMFGGGIYHARSTRIKAGTNVLLAHFHRTQTDIDRKLNGEYIGAWATGCLCKLDPKYAGRSKWNHGFARVEVYKNTFEVHNEIIL